MNKTSDKLIERLNKSKNIDEILFLIKKLKSFRETKVVEAIVPFLEHNDAIVRYIAVQSLQELKMQCSVKPLFESLAEPEDWVRIKIVETIGQLKPDKGSHILLKYLESETDNRVKATIIKALGILNDESIIPFIADYLNSNDSRIKANTIEALEHFNNQKILNLLKPFMRDNNNRVRANTALLFIKKGKKEGYKILEEMLQSSTNLMVASAVYALGELADKKGLELLIENKIFDKKDWSIVRNIITALAKMINNNVEKASSFFEKYLNSEKEEEVLFSIEVTGNYRLKNYLSELTHKLASAKGELREKIDEAIDELLEVDDG
ncbi:MAG: HEAT repeat domain-containing protein [Candidatus Muiribacteriota bacterium]